MKLFARRGGKASPSSSCPSSSQEEGGRSKDTSRGIKTAAAAAAELESDVLVEEWLKLDCNAWNAKQRRMIKRYQARRQQGQDQGHPPRLAQEGEKTTTKQPEGDDDDDDADNDDDDSSNNSSIVLYQDEDDADAVRNDDDEDDLKNQHHQQLSNLPVKEGKEQPIEDRKTVSDPPPTGEQGDEEEGTIKCSAITAIQTGVAARDSGGEEQEEEEENCKEEEPKDSNELWQSLLLELNSKERRTFTRKLDRNEATVSTAIRQAQELLQEKKEKNLTIPKQAQNAIMASGCDNIVAAKNDHQDDRHTARIPVGDNHHNQPTKRKETHDVAIANNNVMPSSLQAEQQGPPKKKPKKKKANSPEDLSSLAPEERLRREEQRRLQKEAAERKQKQHPVSTLRQHRHPLNSERRRANRRKPKWAKKPRPLSSSKTPTATVTTS